jgi:uncharacterized protein (TIGR03000 family)
MKKFLLIMAVAAVATLADTQLASAGRRGGCGGGRGGHCGGCGGGYAGCGMGGCGYQGGGYGGGCGMGGCGSMMGGCGAGGCGYVMGTGATGTYAAMPCVTCGGGVCMVNTVGGSAVASTGNEATIVVHVPADATVTIDDEATTSTSSRRVFVTPALETGKEYHYTLTAQVVRDGKTQTVTERVTVRPGEVSRVELTETPAGVAAQ